MEMASYIFGLLAFMAAALASYYSHRRNKRKLFTAAAIICAVAGAVCWIQDRVWKKEAEQTSSAMPSSSAIPHRTPSATTNPVPAATPIEKTTTPEPSPYQFSPTQIAEKILAEKDFSEQKEIVRAFEGINVDWILVLVSSRRLGNGNVFVSFVEPKNSIGFPTIVCEVSGEGNERLPLHDKTQRFRVKGIIEKVSPINIALEKASFEPISK